MKFGKSYKANQKSYHKQGRYFTDAAAGWANRQTQTAPYRTLPQIAYQSGASNGWMCLMGPPG